MARLYQAGDHVDVAMDVVREPVKEKRDLAKAKAALEKSVTFPPAPRAESNAMLRKVLDLQKKLEAEKEKK